MQSEFAKSFDYNEVTKKIFFSTLLMDINHPQGGECHLGT